MLVRDPAKAGALLDVLRRQGVRWHKESARTCKVWGTRGHGGRKKVVAAVSSKTLLGKVALGKIVVGRAGHIRVDHVLFVGARTGTRGPTCDHVIQGSGIVGQGQAVALPLSQATLHTTICSLLRRDGRGHGGSLSAVLRSSAARHGRRQRDSLLSKATLDIPLFCFAVAVVCCGERNSLLSSSQLSMGATGTVGWERDSVLSIAQTAVFHIASKRQER